MSEENFPGGGWVSKQNRMLHLPDWQLQIIRKYPRNYTERSPEVLSFYTESPEQIPHEDDFCNLRYGFEHDAGWAELIEDLSATATALVRALRSFGFQDNARISACICKEKYGTLAWQGTDNLLPPFRALWFAYARLIEQRSKNMCEVSGKFGKLRNIRGHFRTLSDEEYVKTLRVRRAKREF